MCKSFFYLNNFLCVTLISKFNLLTESNIGQGFDMFLAFLKLETKQLIPPHFANRPIHSKEGGAAALDKRSGTC